MDFIANSDETEDAEVVPAPGQEQPATTPTGYVTPEELNALKKELDDKLANLYRGIQSQNDKLSYRVQQRMNAYEAAAIAQGVTLTPSQKQQLTDQTTIEELRAVSTSAPSSKGSDQNQRQGETDDEFANRVNAAAETMLKIAGITFEETDPEIELINKAAEGDSAEAYLDAHREAIRLKKIRLASSGQQAKPKRSPTGGAPGAVPGSTNTNPIANITNTDQLWEEVERQGKI